MTEPDISVVVLSRDHDELLLAALASIDAQVTDFAVEVVIVDHASTAGSREALAAWSATSALTVRMLDEPDDPSVTDDYARAFAACRGRMIAILNSDDEWIWSQKLDLQARALERSPGVVLVASRCLASSAGAGDRVAEPTIGMDALETRLSSARIADEDLFGTLSACLFRADALERVSAEVFDERAVDWEVVKAITRFGDALLLPQVMTLHRRGRESPHSAGDAEAPTAARHDLSAPDTAPPRHPAIAVPRVRGSHRPRVSVVMTSYNHADFIIEAAQSVLQQSIDDLELIIADDASADASLTVLSGISDPRVRIYALESNHGGAAALNFAIQQTCGDLIAVINSDDIWELSKLERQLQVMDQRPELGAVFTAVRFIDEAGELLAPENGPAWSSIFEQPDRTQGQWLRYFLEHGNALCHPSVLIRRSVYETIGLYDNTLRQLPDLDRWVALVKRFPITVLADEPLIRFRTFVRPTNASSNSTENVARIYHEHLVVNHRLLDAVPDDVLIDGFGDVLRTIELDDPDVRACAVALLWRDCAGPLAEVNKVESLYALRALLRTESGKLVLRTHFGITDRDLHHWAGTAEVARTLDAFHALRQFSLAPEPSEPPVEAAAETVSFPRRALRLMRATPLRDWPSVAIDVMRRRAAR